MNLWGTNHFYSIAASVGVGKEGDVEVETRTQVRVVATKASQYGVTEDWAQSTPAFLPPISLLTSMPGAF